MGEEKAAPLLKRKNSLKKKIKKIPDIP